MPIRNSMISAVTLRSRVAGSVMAVGAMLLTSCQVFDTDVTNPNAVTEDAIATQASAASSLVNGLYGAVNAAGNQIVGTVGAAVLGMILFDEPRDIVRIGCIFLIIAGIAGLKLTS